MSIRDYKITDEQFNEKGMTSLPDTLKGTPYENKKSLEKFTREVVAPQFNAIVDNFADMEESANSWSAEEAQRVQQENARQSAEQGRVSAEGQRATNETARLLAEENRISAENDRVTAETARVNAENGRVSAEAGRRAGEKARNVWEMYSASKAYVPGNKVSFGGSSYVCTAATVGHEPTDTAYWLLIAQKGTDGAGADDLRQINSALDAIDPTKVTAKAAPADGDGVMIADSADGGKAKRLLWSNVKAALGKLFVPLARKINGKALAKDVTLTGENIAVSTTDSTPISGALKYRVNPNLLDNWYFANPVNQRNGYIVPAGVEYYKVDGFVPQGPIPETVRVDYIDYAGSAIFNYGGVPCYVPKGGGYVRGYTGSGYTVDRWKLLIDATNLLIKTGYISLAAATSDYGGFMQLFEAEPLLGQTVTFSALCRYTGSGGNTLPYITAYCGDNVYDGSSQINSTDWMLVSFTHTFPETKPNDNRFGFDIVTMKSFGVDIKAAKLELGDTQTLAHKENGVWVLNEIPDFGEQLRRCQRFHLELPAIYWLPENADGTNRLTIPIPDMRTIPVVTYEPADGNTGTLHYDANLAQKNTINFYAIGATGICGVKNIKLSADL